MAIWIQVGAKLLYNLSPDLISYIDFFVRTHQ